MPIYDFICPRCGKTEERMQDYAEAPPHCPECESPMKRRVSRTNFSLKGEGWGRDNYGCKPSPRAKSE